MKVQVEEKSIDEASASLTEMRRRVEEIVSAPTFTTELMVELLVIFDNVSYVFLYLEASNDFVSYDRLASAKTFFHDNPSLDDRLLELLQGLKCRQHSDERSRLKFIEHLRCKRKKLDAGERRAFEEVEKEAKDLFKRADLDKQALLERLGVSVPVDKASVAYQSLMGRVDDPSTRVKLDRTWRATSQRYYGAFEDIVDQIADLRLRFSQKQGYSSPLDVTLARTNLSEAEVEAFLNRCLDVVLEDQQEIEDEMARACGTEGVAMVHFQSFVRGMAASETLPLFELDDSLKFAFEFCRAVFSLEFHVLSSHDAPVLVADVLENQRRLGRITFDLWNLSNRELAANQTVGLRNRADWGSFTQYPEAYVSCKFDLSPNGDKLLTFQNLHSLFHELGHAINHLLIRERIPNQSGLEYLPLERLECLSMWFEKWVYHKEFIDFVAGSGVTPKGLDLCRKIRRLEYRRSQLERTIIAIIDLNIHSSHGKRFVECYYTLDRQFGIGRFVDFSDLPSYFFLPLARHNPGGNFIYLWGSAWSCENFAFYQERTLAEIAAAPDRTERFEPCFDFDLPSAKPDVGVFKSFFRDPTYVLSSKDFPRMTELSEV